MFLCLRIEYLDLEIISREDNKYILRAYRTVGQTGKIKKKSPEGQKTLICYIGLKKIEKIDLYCSLFPLFLESSFPGLKSL